MTFGLLLAREQGISLDGGIDAAARKFSGSNSLIGTRCESSLTALCRRRSCPPRLAPWDGCCPW